MIEGKIKFFEMDYFGSKQAFAELTTGWSIHLYHNDRNGCTHIDLYRGNDIVVSRDIPPNWKYEYVHLCRGYLKVKFLAFFPEINRGLYYLATIPHDVGKKCTVKVTV